MTQTIRFAAPIYPAGRHCLLCGNVTMGAAFPPGDSRSLWVWRLFSFGARQPRIGASKTEAAAKDALLAALADTLAEAGLRAVDQMEVRP